MFGYKIHTYIPGLYGLVDHAGAFTIWPIIIGMCGTHTHTPTHTHIHTHTYTRNTRYGITRGVECFLGQLEHLYSLDARKTASSINMCK